MTFIFKLFLLSLLFPLIASSVELESHNFSTDLEGWSGNGVSRQVFNNGATRMKIQRDKTATQTYDFGIAYANQVVTVEFLVRVRDVWEDSGSYKDFLRIYANGSNIENYSYPNGTHTESFLATIRNDGTLTLAFNADTTSDDERAWIDNIIISTSSVITGCDNTLDTSANNNNPGTRINDMHGITVLTIDCISGSSRSDDNDWYYFTIATRGTLEINTSSPNGHNNHFEVISTTNGTLHSYDTGQNRTLSFDLVSNESIILRMKETGEDTDIWQINLGFTPYIEVQSPPTISAIPNQSTQAASAYSFNLASFVSLTNDDPILSYSLAGTLPSGLSFNTSTGLLSGTPTVGSTTSFTLSLTATDNDGTSSAQTFRLSITVPPINASNDTYSLTPSTTVTGNVITDDSGNGIDTGTAITMTAHTRPSEGTLSINSSGGFSYTPASSPSSSVTFTYTITDSYGSTDTATVTFEIGTDYIEGLQTFTLINPPNTRNIVGSYKLAGNTVLCLTDKTGVYGGECHGKTDYKLETSNRKMSAYIDIDGDNSTWNSTSSYIELPNNYDRLGGQGIVWAGLFWQGRVSSDTNPNGGYPLRHGEERGTGYTLIDTGKGKTYGNFNIENIGANDIKLKIDGGTYSDVKASTLYYVNHRVGTTYAAFSDVTSLLQAENISHGKHTFTVANLTASEGRQASPGIFGGWALVVIYLEDPLNGSPQNISIYNGFDSITKYNDPLSISGFRLPSSGNSVKANLSLFSGEGEYRYGRTETSNNKDTIQISNNLTSNYTDMNGSSSPLNIFDAVLDGVLRDDIPGHSNNLEKNSNGIDVDNFNVSDAVTGYRDSNPLIDTIYIKYYSDNDYITPSMIAFSTELYQPNICYNYTLDIDGYVFNSSNNEVNISYGGQTDEPITTRISIQSQEGDFELEDVNITYRLADSSQLHYVTDSTALAPNGISSYIPAGTNGLNQTYDQINNGFGMYIGTGANPVPGPGGTIGSYQTRYLKFDTQMMRNDINTFFNLWIEYKVDYGSGPLTLSKNFNASSLCNGDGGYYPAYNIFNIASSTAERSASSSHFGMPYNLYTQVSNHAFDLTVFSYLEDGIYLTPNEVNTSVEVEMFNAGHFDSDTNVSCNNPDSNITSPIFVKFDSETSVPLSSVVYPKAIRNTGFRIWYLTKPDGSFLEHQCHSKNNETCFDTLYNNEYTDDSSCQIECSGGGYGCYQCIRTYYGKPICSRDNFSVRPEAFITQILDSNQSIFTDMPTKSLGSSTNISSGASRIVAGYNYRFDVNATSYTSNTPVSGYHQKFNADALSSWSHVNWTGDPGLTCNNTDDVNISMSIFNGSSINIKPIPNEAIISTISDVGEYSFSIEDENWTVVDWYHDYLKHHYDKSGALLSGFDSGTDCIRSSTSVSSRSGCLISSTHTKENTTYSPLPLHSYPNAFNLNLEIAAHPTYNKNFVYINTLALDKEDENISYNIKGTFQARNYTDDALSNFIDGCYAEDTNMSLTYTYLSELPDDLNLDPANHTPNLTYDLKDYNTTNSSNIVRAREIGTLGTANGQDIQSTATITQLEQHYEASMNGAITMDWGINFNRNNDNDDTTALNPRLIQFNDLNISLSSGVQSNVDLKDDHQIFGDVNIDANISFFYARAKTARTLYDDITQSLVVTPISVVVYCNLGFTFCEELGINTDDGQTSEFDWWKSWEHNNVDDQDGRVVIASTPITALSETIIGISEKGENSTITVSRGVTIPSDPIPIELVTDTSLTEYTDRWLLHKVTSPFYRVKFIGELDEWVGYGKTGHVVGGKSNIKKNRRLEW